MIRESDPILFEEVLGESLIPKFSPTVGQNRLAVGFIFRGMSLDRYVNEPAFQLLAQRLVANSTFGYFAMPADPGTQAVLRAWWLHKNRYDNRRNVSPLDVWGHRLRQSQRFSSPRASH